MNSDKVRLKNKFNDRDRIQTSDNDVGAVGGWVMVMFAALGLALVVAVWG